MDWFIQLALYILVLILGILVEPLFKGYFGEKGRNLATKKDIKEITDKIEEVRAEYTKQVHVHQIAFDKEFEILSTLWKALVELRRATEELRPALDIQDPSKIEKDIKKDRLEKYIKKNVDLVKIIDDNKPFYPQKISQGLGKVLKICQSEADEYHINYPHFVDTKADYWFTAIENRQRIYDEVDKVEKLIPERLMNN